ncbi:hypothetical protein [Pseudonocardia sp. N23]|uniref:VG15 protein n=1 Tax=Pseudonocardia sp. N23 TaxID=1987376 RepID=UPI000BFD5151|nr:hypothetical protein [Pseudonocardia sp. N23]GAY12043.1 hypothetical protein TOK_0433 [Pseudonocardia sp. N23]
MPLVELRTQQDLISREAAQLVLPILLRGVEAELPNAGWLRLAALLYPQVLGWRQRSAAIAYLAARAVLPSADRPARLPYDLSWTVQALRSTIVDRDRRSPGWSPARVAADGTARLVRHVEQAGRETTLQVSEASGGEGRWARVSDGAPCAFCALFVSRGPVYHTEGARSGGFRAHDHDRCVAVLVRKDQREWPGREEFERVQEIYYDASIPYSGEEKWHAFRRAWEKSGGPAE